MPNNSADAAALARGLLDLQVAHHLEQVSDSRLSATLAAVVEDAVAAGGCTIDELVDADVAKDVASRALTAASREAERGPLVELLAGVVLAGPRKPYPVGDLVARERIEALVDELLALTPLLSRVLDRLTASPLVGTMAARFMGRIVGEVVAANQAVADKLPGLGSLMSFGTSTAAKFMGAADKQLEGLLGETVGKGGALAVKRLNRIIVETLQDPTTREAVLQVWDLIAEEQVTGLEGKVTAKDLSGPVDATRAVVRDVLAGDQAAELAAAIIDAFLGRYGDHTPAQVLHEFGWSTEEIVAEAQVVAGPVVATLRESGELERMIRERLAPFYASPEVLALLEG